MANGNGTKNWIMVVAVLVALTTSIISFARDTPTRSEVNEADLLLKQDIQHHMDSMEARLTRQLERIENKVDGDGR